MRKLYFLFCFLCLFITVFAQSDSIAFTNAKWSYKRIAPGVSWKSFHFKNNELFSSNQNINIVEISPKSKRFGLDIVRSDSLEPTSQIAMRGNAIAGINGSFFKMRGPDPDYRSDLTGVPKREPAKLGRNRSIVYFRENDSLISENIPGKDSIRKRHQQGSIVIAKRSVSILKGDSVDLRWEEDLSGEDIISTGPVMLLSGMRQQIPNDAFCNDRHPRTALGKKADGTIILLVVDGRFEESAGMSIHELQNVLKWLGCSDAINLDGGGSTAMFIKGQPFNGIVNHPSDNKKFDHYGEREVANALLLVKKPKSFK